MWTINLAQSSERERFTSVLYYCATQAVWEDFLTLFYRPSQNECVIFSLAAFWSGTYISASVVTARILSYFGFPSLSFTKSAGSVSVAGPLKLRWFSHPIQYYLHVPNVSIYRWSSNFVNLSSCWIEKGAISSNLPCVFIVWRDNFIRAFVTKLNVETKGTHTNNVILQYTYCGIYKISP